GLEQTAVPRWRPGTGRQRGVRRGVRTEEDVVPAMKEHRGEVNFLDVPLTDQARAVKAHVADSGAWDTISSLRELEIRGCFSDVRESSDTLQSEASNLEGPAGSEVSVVAAV